MGKPVAPRGAQLKRILASHLNPPYPMRMDVSLPPDTQLTLAFFSQAHWLGAELFVHQLKRSSLGKRSGRHHRGLKNDCNIARADLGCTGALTFCLFHLLQSCHPLLPRGARTDASCHPQQQQAPPKGDPGQSDAGEPRRLCATRASRQGTSAPARASACSPPTTGSSHTRSGWASASGCRTR